MPSDSLLTRLEALRRRLLAQAFAERLARAVIVVLLFAIVFSVAERWFSVVVHWELFALAGAALALVWASIVTRWCSPALPAVAALLDRLGTTRDRWTSALEFSHRPSTPAQELAHRECAAYL